MWGVFQVKAPQLWKEIKRIKANLNHHYEAESTANLVEAIEDFEEDEDIEYADLPDLSDIEEMLDWDEGENSENISLNDESKYNRSEDSDI